MITVCPLATPIAPPSRARAPASTRSLPPVGIPFRYEATAMPTMITGRNNCRVVMGRSLICASTSRISAESMR